MLSLFSKKYLVIPHGTLMVAVEGSNFGELCMYSLCSIYKDRTHSLVIFKEMLNIFFIKEKCRTGCLG